MSPLTSGNEFGLIQIGACIYVLLASNSNVSELINVVSTRSASSLFTNIEYVLVSTNSPLVRDTAKLYVLEIILEPAVGRPKLISGGCVYPDPLLITSTSTTVPFVTLATNSAPEPVSSAQVATVPDPVFVFLKLIVGAVVYPVPGSVITILTTPVPITS